ncbi:AfsR/SARP family transcriptional regulator [Nakamurella sp.]|uniref:AfsR/SARP family transcriptional regulator n=1 Tax=Nakamurella sp. TaxID=1869182 RepID=UPI003B3B1052
MQIRDLGPLTVELDGLPSAVGHGRLAAVLGPLAYRTGEVLPPATLIEAVWGRKAPDRAGQLLESLIWRLRKELEPGRAARAEPVVLRREPAGYRLDLPPAGVDSARLRTAVPRLRAAATAGRPDEVLTHASGVLALWRGEPYAQVPDTGWLGEARHLLAAARLDVAVLRVQALLDLGRPEEAVGALDPLLAEHPLHEHLRVLQMTGLYRSGRPADALAVYGRARAVLAEELGVDPGPELRELHRRVLDHDPGLGLETRPGRDRTGTRPAPSTAGRLPRRRTSLIGRADDIARITNDLVGSALITLVGPGGAGKTRLAVEVGHVAAPAFPDGVRFVDLAPIGPDLVEATLAGAFALAGRPDRTPLDTVADHLADRRVLVVLDNCEHVVAAAAAVVDELGTRCPGVRVLATSREPLDLPGERRHAVGPLPVRAAPDADLAPAVQLFVERAGAVTAVRAAGDGDGDGDGDDDEDGDGDTGATADDEVIARICAAVGGLPLGIELAAAQARTFELAEILADLERNPAGLARRGAGPARQASMRETVDWGYRLARRDEQILHRRLAVIPGPFALDAAAALCAGPPLRGDAALSLVGGLVHRSLLTSSRPARTGGSTTFQQLVPIRAHAAEELGPDERDAAEIARDGWLLARLAAAPLDGRRGHADALGWLDDSAAALHATLESTLDRRPDRRMFDVFGGLIFYWYDRGRLAEAQHRVHRFRAAVDRVAADPVDRALAEAAAGSVLALRHRGAEAAPLLRRCRPVLAGAPAARSDAVATALLVAAAAAWTGDIWDVAADFVDTILAWDGAAGRPHLTMVARAIRSANWSFTGDRAAGIAQARQVLRDNEALGNDIAALFALVALAITALTGGDPAAALAHSDELLLTHRRLGALAVADTIETRASIRAAAGETAEAVRCLGASAAMNRRLGRDWPWHEFTRPVLDGLRRTVDPGDFATWWASGERLGLGDPGRFTPDWI